MLEATGRPREIGDVYQPCTEVSAQRQSAHFLQQPVGPVRQISLVKALRSRAIFFESTATLVDARSDGMADDFAVAADAVLHGRAMVLYATEPGNPKGRDPTV